LGNLLASVLLQAVVCRNGLTNILESALHLIASHSAGGVQKSKGIKRKTKESKDENQKGNEF